MYAVRNLVTSIFLAELHLCLMNVPLQSTTFCLDLDRSGWCKGLPLLLGKWIRDGHDSLGNSTHNLSDQEDPFTVCQSDAAVASQKSIPFFEVYPYYSPPPIFILGFFLPSFLLDCVGDDTHKFHQQMATLLALSVPSGLSSNLLKELYICLCSTQEPQTSNLLD